MFFNKKKKPRIENIEQELIDYIRKLRFRHHLIGIDEKEVWIVVSNIQKYYARKNLENEIKYKALLEEREQEIERLNRKLKGIEGKELRDNGNIGPEKESTSQGN